MAQKEEFQEGVFDPDRLYSLRHAASLTQQELAKKLGLEHNTIGKWEKGENKPSARNLRSLARVLEVTITDLCKRPKAQVVIDLDGYSDLERQAILALLQIDGLGRARLLGHMRGLLAIGPEEAARAAADLAAAGAAARARRSGKSRGDKPPEHP